jgi:hypothetical protein
VGEWTHCLDSECFNWNSGKILRECLTNQKVERKDQIFSKEKFPLKKNVLISAKKSLDLVLSLLFLMRFLLLNDSKIDFLAFNLSRIAFSQVDFLVRWYNMFT